MTRVDLIQRAIGRVTYGSPLVEKVRWLQVRAARLYRFLITCRRKS